MGTGGVSAFAALEGVPEDPSSVVVGRPLPFPRKTLGGGGRKGGAAVVGMGNGPSTVLENGSSVGSGVEAGAMANGGGVMHHHGSDNGGGRVDGDPAGGLEKGGGGSGDGVEGGDVPMAPSSLAALPPVGAVGDAAAGGVGDGVTASVNSSSRVHGEAVVRRRQLSPTTTMRRKNGDVSSSSPVSNATSMAEGRLTGQSGDVPLRGENRGGVLELVDPAATRAEGGGGGREDDESAFRRPGYIVKMGLTLYKVRQGASNFDSSVSVCVACVFGV